jgi:hypothetical protein
MLVYRVTRAPERRVYKIYVGNIDDADVDQHMLIRIADRFKRMHKSWIHKLVKWTCDTIKWQMTKIIFIPVRK